MLQPGGLSSSHPHCKRTRFNKQNKIFVLKACYLHNNCCQAHFIGLNARPFRVRFPKLFSSVLRAGNWVPSKVRNHSPHFTFSFNARWTLSWNICQPSDFLQSKALLRVVANSFCFLETFIERTAKKRNWWYFIKLKLCHVMKKKKLCWCERQPWTGAGYEKGYLLQVANRHLSKTSLATVIIERAGFPSRWSWSFY